MNKIVSLNLNNKLIKKIEEFSQKKRISKSQAANIFLELGLQKQTALDTARELELLKLKNDIVNELKTEFNDTKNTVAKIEEHSNKILNVVLELQHYTTVLEELLFIAILVKKFTANTAAGVQLTQERIDKIKQETDQESKEFLQAILPQNP